MEHEIIFIKMSFKPTKLSIAILLMENKLYKLIQESLNSLLYVLNYNLSSYK